MYTWLIRMINYQWLMLIGIIIINSFEAFINGWTEPSYLALQVLGDSQPIVSPSYNWSAIDWAPYIVNCRIIETSKKIEFSNLIYFYFLIGFCQVLFFFWVAIDPPSNPSSIHGIAEKVGRNLPGWRMHCPSARRIILKLGASFDGESHRTHHSQGRY